jgi:hypothetical protein
VIGSGFLVGLSLGLGDGVAVLLENPRSFDAPGTSTPFLAASLAIALGACGLAGIVVAGIPGLARRLPPGLALGGGMAGAAFLALGVRAHVRWFFGESLTAPLQLLGGLALAVGCAALGFLVGRLGGRRIRPHLGETGLLVGAAAAFAGTAALAFALRPARIVEPPAGPPVPGARDVLLLTLDTTRADRLSVYGYPRGTTPALDRLARRGLLWESAYAPIPLTNPSHASLLTGVRPREHGVLNNGTALSTAVPTFVPVLAERGWKCAAFVSGIPLKAGLSGLASGFSVYDDAFSPLERVHPMLTALALVRVANRVLPGDFIERRARDTVREAIAWLEGASGPRFLWVHLFDPHTPYDAPGILRRRFAREASGWTAGGGALTGWPHADYDAELRETDRWLGRLLRAWDDATAGRGSVIVVGDHGEGLEQHGELTHGSQLYEEDVRVPCLWRVSDGTARPNRVHRPVRGITEVRRSLAWAAGIDRAPPEPEVAPIVIETFAPEGRRDLTALIDRRGRKIVLDRTTGTEIAFDLVTDPGERRPMAGRDEDWDNLRESLPEDPVDRREGLDPETVRRLRALGYIH